MIAHSKFPAVCGCSLLLNDPRNSSCALVPHTSCLSYWFRMSQYNPQAPFSGMLNFNDFCAFCGSSNSWEEGESRSISHQSLPSTRRGAKRRSHLPCRFWRCLGWVVQGWERFALMNSVVPLAIICVSSLAILREVSTYTGLFQGTSSALGRDWGKADPEHKAKGVFREF